MGLFGLLGLIIVFGGISVMSKTSRVVLAVLVAGSVYYWQSISAVLHGGSGPNMNEFKMAFTLLSAIIGVFIVASILGIMRKNSVNDQHYQEKRRGLFVFLTKWGLIYVIYVFIAGKLIDLGLGESGVGWFFVRVWGLGGFIALLVLWFLFKPRRKPAQGK